jgi:protein-S-isoprenylcysteine O-methyltransferase Ste14
VVVIGTVGSASGTVVNLQHNAADHIRYGGAGSARIMKWHCGRCSVHHGHHTEGHVNKAALRLVWLAMLAILAVGASALGQGVRLAIGVLIGLPSFVLMLVSRVQLGASFSVNPEARGLVTAGVYSKIEHPMYLFLDMFILALIIIPGWPLLLPVWGILAIIQMLQARKEEQVLAAAFGAEYEEYRSHTWL